MPRPRSATSIEAERCYRDGAKLVDIAKSLNVPEGTVRRWKSDQDWDGKKKATERSEIKPGAKPNARKRTQKNATNDVPKKKEGKTAAQSSQAENTKSTQPSRGGAPLGNKNAVGNDGGALPGNKNAVTTGEFETIMYGDLTDEERALLDAPLDPVSELERSLLFERVRIHRMNRRTVTAEKAPGGMVIDNAVKVHGVITGRVPLGTQTTADAGVNRADRFENSLTRVILGRQKGLAELHKMKSTSADTELVDDWLGGDDWDD